MALEQRAGSGRGPVAFIILAILAGTAVVAGVFVWLTFATLPPFRGPAVPRAAVAPPPAPVPGHYVAELVERTRPPEFSDGTVQYTHKGHRLLLGRYRSAGVTFTLDGLPQHQAVHLVMDLAVLNSWNGSSTRWGPDVWLCDDRDDGRHLAAATFCNCGFFVNNNEQSFPDEFPSPPGATPHPAWTGAAERQTLGESRTFTNTTGDPSADCSSVYHLDWTIPHTRPALHLVFKRRAKDGTMNFGFLSFRADSVAALPTLSDPQRQAAWADMGGEDPVKAYTAVWTLAATGEAAMPFIQQQLTHAGGPDGPTASPYLSGRVRHLLDIIGTPSAKAAAGQAP